MFVCVRYVALTSRCVEVKCEEFSRGALLCGRRNRVNKSAVIYTYTHTQTYVHIYSGIYVGNTCSAHHT